jgi:hypothetical protein
MNKIFNQDAILSFRSYLQKGMSHFVSDFQQSDSVADVLAEFIIVLSSYQEEGVQLFPIVFIGEDLSEILSITQGIDPIVVGQGEQNRESVRRAFKRFAPLTEGRAWAAFVILQKNSMSYGVFRTSQSPLLPTAFECLRQTQNPDLRVLGLSRLGGSFVEIRSASGQYKYINMSGEYEEAKNPPKLIYDFMNVVTKDAPPEVLPHLRSFYYRVGVDLLHANHGALLAVTHFNQEIPEIFQDGILLKERIDLSKAISKFLDTSDRESYQRLVAWSQLLRRMTRMDGITLVDTSGAIVGYNCFIRNSDLEFNPKFSSSGGARRRAFDVLRTHLGEHLSGVIYKSQDGVIEMGIS